MTLSQWITEFRNYYPDNYVSPVVPKFNDTTVEIILRETVINIFGSSVALEQVTFEYKYQVLALSKINAIRRLAQDAAAFFSYSEGISGDSIDKTKTMDNLLKLADSLEAQYNKTYPSGIGSANAVIGISYNMERESEEAE